MKLVIKCTNVGIEPNEECCELCVKSHSCAALKLYEWEKEKDNKKNHGIKTESEEDK